MGNWTVFRDVKSKNFHIRNVDSEIIFLSDGNDFCFANGNNNIIVSQQGNDHIIGSPLRQTYFVTNNTEIEREVLIQNIGDNDQLYLYIPDFNFHSDIAERIQFKKYN